MYVYTSVYIDSRWTIYLCIYAHVRVHTHTHARAHARARAHTHTQIYTCIHTRAHTHTHTHAHAHAPVLYACTDTYTYAPFLCTCACVFVHTHTHTSIAYTIIAQGVYCAMLWRYTSASRPMLHLSCHASAPKLLSPPLPPTSNEIRISWDRIYLGLRET